MDVPLINYSKANLVDLIQQKIKIPGKYDDKSSNPNGLKSRINDKQLIFLSLFYVFKNHQN
jgi:hypothetical protein